MSSVCNVFGVGGFVGEPGDEVPALFGWGGCCAQGIVIPSPQVRCHSQVRLGVTHRYIPPSSSGRMASHL